MTLKFLPDTKPGKWSVILFTVLIVLVAYFFLMTGVFNQTGGETFFSNLNLAIPMVVAWASGLVSLILGVLAVFGAKSRSVLVFIIILLTLITTIYGLIAVLPE